MLHPSHSPAVFKALTAEEQKLKGLFAPVPECLSPERYPPVTVTTLDQEKLYASKGYRPANNPTPQEYDEAILESKHVDGFVYQAYPKYKYHAVNIPVIVKDAAEEEALGEGWEDAPIIASEDDIQKAPPTVKKARVAKAKKVKTKAKRAVPKGIVKRSKTNKDAQQAA